MAVGGVSVCPRVTSVSVQTDGKLMAKGSAASGEEGGTGVGGRPRRGRIPGQRLSLPLLPER